MLLTTHVRKETDGAQVLMNLVYGSHAEVVYLQRGFQVVDVDLELQIVAVELVPALSPGFVSDCCI